jgi:hypothetical protein
MSATALQPTAVTRAIRPAALVELQVEALPVALQHALPPGAVAAAAPAYLVVPAQAHLPVQVRRVVSLPVVLPVQVVLLGQVVLLAASALRGRLRVALRGEVEHRVAARRGELPAVATTGH